METLTSKTADRSVSGEVVEEVAAREGVQPTDLDPLYGVVDPDALDSLFRNGSGTVTFEYHGYEVIAGSDGHVALRDLEE